MVSPSHSIEMAPLGIVGFGAFGQLMARHLRPHFEVVACDRAADVEAALTLDVALVDLDVIARCRVIVLAVPVSAMRGVLAELAPQLAAGTVVLDVGSVKLEPAAALLELLPDHVEIVATHPLFGPQSALDGILGHRIAVCPLRGRRFRVAAFLRKLALEVILTTPEDHDRDLAQVQGLTHAIARLLSEMKPSPTRMTTRSYELLMSAVDMVRHDSADVSDAIFRRNPFAADVLTRFMAAAARFGNQV